MLVTVILLSCVMNFLNPAHVIPLILKPWIRYLAWNETVGTICCFFICCAILNTFIIPWALFITSMKVFSSLHIDMNGPHIQKLAFNPADVCSFLFFPASHVVLCFPHIRLSWAVFSLAHDSTRTVVLIEVIICAFIMVSLNQHPCVREEHKLCRRRKDRRKPWHKREEVRGGGWTKLLCTLHQILLAWWNEGEWNGRSM